MDVQGRLDALRRLLDGDNGLEARFLDLSVSVRVNTAMIDKRQAYIDGLGVAFPVEVKQKILNDFAMFQYSLEILTEQLEATAEEITRMRQEMAGLE